MFVQNKAAISPREKNGLAVRSRRGGQEILVQWENGRQKWHPASDIAGSIVFIEGEKSYQEEYDHGA